MCSIRGVPSPRPDAPPPRAYLILLGAALLVRITTALLIPEPGYMDTAYYTVMGQRIAQGRGATEPFLWNYLDDPSGLPAPAFGYWMPLPSILAAPFWAIGGSFFAAQMPFALCSALLVVLGAHIAWRATGRMHVVWGAGGLLIFSGYFFPMWTLPETFAPFALLGAVALWAGGEYIYPPTEDWEQRRIAWAALMAGAATLAYLTRSDGLLLVAMALALPLFRRDGRSLVVSALVVALLLTPWFLYNLDARGALMPTGGTRTLWLTEYDDHYCYPCALSPQSYLAWGWGNILRSKWEALVWNAKTLLGVLGYVVLAPLALIGSWRLRERPAFVLAALYLTLLFSAMTFAFSFSGPRGGFFHSGGALLPFIVTAGLVGLNRGIIWLGGQRNWHIAQAQRVFTAGLVVIALGMSLALAAPKLAAWRDANAPYRWAADWLEVYTQERALDPACPVLVGNPPGFWYATHIPALAVPNEDAATAAALAERYGACWLLLNENRPAPLAPLYESGGCIACNIGETCDEAIDWTFVASWSDGHKLYRLSR
jgi:hypothetical protein